MILELLHGVQKPQTADKLCEQLGMTQRQLKEIIRRERLNGAPICSCKYGYYRAVTPDEIELTCHHLKSRINETTRTLLALEDTARNLQDNQKR